VNLPFIRLAAHMVPSARDWHLTTSEKVPSPFLPMILYSVRRGERARLQGAQKSEEKEGRKHRLSSRLTCGEGGTCCLHLFSCRRATISKVQPAQKEAKDSINGRGLFSRREKRLRWGAMREVRDVCVCY
jgi:hypothetical protein